MLSLLQKVLSLLQKFFSKENFDRRKRRWFNITGSEKKAGGSKSFLHLKNYYLLSKQRGQAQENA